MFVLGLNPALFTIVFSALVLLRVERVDSQGDPIAETNQSPRYSSENYTSSSPFQTNLNILLTSLVSNGSRDGFFNTSIGVGPDIVYGLVQCRGDISQDSCRSCLYNSTVELIRRSTNRRVGTLRYDHCILRYANTRFFSQIDRVAKNEYNRRRVSDVDAERFSEQLTSLLTNVSRVAANRTNRYHYGNALYSPSGRRVSISGDSLQFDFNTIQLATNNFSDFNKLGEGGFGAVYKGELLDGREIAVKRLSTRSSQGSQEFKNEVMLLHKLQHRNLVRLLGFCLAGEEKLLVYEYIRNRSLDKYIFDSSKTSFLDWASRYKIIEGIARALVYLHEDSRLRIIHRDLKAANVLLDDEMNAKVADFGMARLFGADQTRGNISRIAGTLGYMAPEYLTHGMYSVKSDVFSFGVLLLEILSGQSISEFHHSGSSWSLLSYAWKLWKEANSLDLIDPILANNFSENEATRCIHIALLCVQNDLEARPSMSSIVLMLSSYSLVLDSPSSPAFTTSTTLAFKDQNGSLLSNDLDLTVPT